MVRPLSALGPASARVARNVCYADYRYTKRAHTMLLRLTPLFCAIIAFLVGETRRAFTDVALPGTVGMRGSAVIRLRPCLRISVLALIFLQGAQVVGERFSMS